jgi:hypothetical protein
VQNVAVEVNGAMGIGIEEDEMLKYNLLCDPGYVISYVSILTDEKSSVNMF